jgi:hypothetical protein
MIPGLQMRVQLRDRPLLDVIDLSFRFIATHAWLFAKVALAALVLPYALCVWVGDNVNWGVAWIAAFALGALAQTPFTMLASKLVFQERTTAREAIFATFGVLPRIVLARFFQALVLVASSVMCAVPIFFFGPAFLFLPEIVLLEGVNFSNAATRGWRLAMNQSGDAFGAWFLLVLATFASVLLLGDVVGRQLMENVFEISPPETIFTSGGNYLAMLGFWIFVPFCAASRFFIYLNLRTKIEGWDIQARFLALTLRARGST